MDKAFIDKVYKYLTIFIFVELIVGGLGNLFGLPIRKGLFVLGTILTLYMMIKNNIKLKKSYIIAIILVIGYVMYGSIIGILNGNSFGDIFSDANSFLGIIYILLIANYFQGSFDKLDKYLDLFIKCSLVVALITISLFFFSRLYLPQDHSIIQKYMKLNDIFQYGLITGLVNSNNYARVYLFNGIFMQMGALILIMKFAYGKEKFNLLNCLKLLILLIGVFVSNTRGFWIGIAVGIVLFFIHFLWKRKQNNLSIKGIAITLILFYIFTLLLPLTINKNIGGTASSGTEDAKDRVESIVDFENNISNKIRVIQLEFLVKRIKEKPVLGWGFGAHIEEYGEYMTEHKLPPVHTSNFELYYVELLFKTGFIGIIYLFGYLIYKFIQLIIILFKYKITKQEEFVLISWTIALLAFLASSVTNPYLASLSGFFVLVMEFYILQEIWDKYSKNKV